jgi:hypothetical protein
MDDGRMAVDPQDEAPIDDDVIIWHLEDRDGLDTYRLTKGPTMLGEFTGRSIGATVFQTAVEHAEPGRLVWLNDDLGFRRLKLWRSGSEPEDPDLKGF